MVLHTSEQARELLRNHPDEANARLPVAHLRGADIDEVISAHPLLGVDYGESLVVGVFVGARPNITYELHTDSVVADDERIRLRVTLTGGCTEGGSAVVYPAQFIVLAKPDVGDRKIDIEMQCQCRQTPCAWEEV